MVLLKIVKSCWSLLNWKVRILTRFPPEPNGHLYIGHAKALYLNFNSVKKLYGGSCNLRYDDTNPKNERQEYYDNILRDVRWLGYEPSYVSNASDYFPELLNFAHKLIEKGKAYVCFESKPTVQKKRISKGYSIYRSTPIQENKTQFDRMVIGEYEEGSCTLRFKVDYSEQPTLLRPNNLSNN